MNGVFNMIDTSVASLKKMQQTNIERVLITDAGMKGVYEKSPTGTEAVDDYIVLKDYWNNKYVRLFGEKLIVEVPVQASYTVKGEELLRITNDTIKTIVIPDSALPLYIGRELEIKDETGAVNSGDISIVTESAKIDGQIGTSLSIPYGSLIIRSNGTDLFTKARYG